MNNSPTEQEFISWFNQVHPAINPYIFIQRFNRYSDEYPPIIEDIMTRLHHQIRTQKPNINFSFKGRIKSKRSFLIKSFVTFAKNTEKIFPGSIPTEESARQKVIEESDSAINKFLKFIEQENAERFKEMKNLIISLNNTPLTPTERFRSFFSKLDKSEQDKLVTRLGRTEDTFAYRPIIQSVDFSIKEFKMNADGNIEIIDENGNSIPIHSAIAVNPNTDITLGENGLRYINLNGKKTKFNSRNLLYPVTTRSSERKFENAQRNPDGTLTLLQDSIIFSDGTDFEISSIKYDKNSNSFLAYNPHGECRNLTLALYKHKTIKLRKYDEETITTAAYDIFSVIQDFYKANNITSIQSRFKDYIKYPKEKTDYMSIHDSSFDEIYGYTMETQIRSLLNEDVSKGDSLPITKKSEEKTNSTDNKEEIESTNHSLDHDNYKKEKVKSLKRNSILSSILEKNELAFDSSTSTLMKVLENPDMELSEVLGQYIIVTSMKGNSSISYQPPINTVFEHTFEHADIEEEPTSDNGIQPLNFSSYKAFIQSKKIRNAQLSNDTKFFDMYE